MIKSLYIKNLAIIDELKVSFSKGLNIITGETGSGKSLIVKSIQLLLGKRFSNDLIRKGSNQLLIEGIFSYNDKEIAIKRLYNINQTSKSYINEVPISQKKLIERTKLLVDLHGQHDHQNLLNSKTHIKYLDLFGNYDYQLDEFSKLFKQNNEIKNKLDELIINQKSSLEKKELYKFQFEEINKYPISEKYENTLMDEYITLSKAKDIKNSLDTASRLFDSGNESIIKKLIIIVNELGKYSSNNKDIKNLTKRLNSNRLEIEDILFEIQNINQNIIEDEVALNTINDKIIYIEMLKRKYGGSIKSILNYKNFLDTNNDKNNLFSLEIEKLKQLYSKNNKNLIKNAKSLSKMRNDNSKKLEYSINNNLKILNMKDTKFKINLDNSIDYISEKGMDICEFFICTNLGENLLPISDIASGGEISRIMLAIKMSLQANDIIDTVVFDEIDSGISGATADIVGSIFENLSKSHQILCITHLSQIAGKNGSHINVSKHKNNSRVIVKIKHLTIEQRIDEVAKLISGKKITKTSKQQAKELLDING